MMLKLLSICILSLTLFSVRAQSKVTPVPEFIDQPYIWLKETNQLIALSKEISSLGTKGMINTKINYRFDGVSSKSVVSSAKQISILIQSTMPASLSVATIYKLAVKKNYREVNGMGTQGSRIESNKGKMVFFNVKHVIDDIYELVFSSALEKGEYVIMFGMNSFSFSIR